MRLYCNTNLKPNQTITLPEDASAHARVLRVKTGEKLTLFNGQKGEYEAIIESIGKNITANIIAFHEKERELPYRITLIQGLPEGSKMDFIIEKSVELGVFAICPLKAERSVVKLTEERAQKRMGRWENIVISASEQCGRNRLAPILNPLSVSEISITKPTLLISPRATESLSHWAKKTPPVDLSLFIGPEGGFSEKEESLLIQKGAFPVSLGDRIVRTETAAIVAISTINAHWTL